MNHTKRASGTASSPASGRSPGTRAALLASARRLFARRGFDGASIRAITHDAGASLGAVTYHFGSKHALYEQVLEDALGPLAGRVQDAAAGPGGALDRADRIMRAFFEHLAGNPDLPQLMLQQIAAGKRPPPPVARTLGAVSAQLAAVIRAGQEDGTIRAGDPALLGLSVIAQPVHLTLIHPLARDVMGVDQTDADMRARVVDHAAAFARAGLGVAAAAAQEDA